MGLVHATIGSHEQAVEHFGTAVAMDRYLAVAYFQSGVSNFLLGRYPEARRDFDDTYIVSCHVVDVMGGTMLTFLFFLLFPST